MRLLPLFALIAAALFAGAGYAQSTPDPKKPAEAKAASRSEPKDVKKAPPKKAPPKKAPKKHAPKDAKKAAKGEELILGPGTYSTGPAVLRDKDGNVIPTNPGAYNVDSALKKK